MKTYWTFFGIDVLILLTLTYFFLDVLGSRRLDAVAMGMWVLLIGIPAGVLLGGHFLKAAGRPGLATLLLVTLAVPGLLSSSYLLLLFVMYATHGGWNR